MILLLLFYENDACVCFLRWRLLAPSLDVCGSRIACWWLFAFMVAPVWGCVRGRGG